MFHVVFIVETKLNILIYFVKAKEKLKDKLCTRSNKLETVCGHSFQISDAPCDILLQYQFLTFSLHRFHINERFDCHSKKELFTVCIFIEIKSRK